MKSKIAPFLISLLFLFSCGKSPAKEEKGSLIYQVDEKDGVAMVSGYSGSLSQESVLSEYKGYPVTSIGPSAFEDCSSLRSLSLLLSITSIGSRAFYQCSSLSEMNLPTSLLSIGTEAFSWCVSLSEIVIPSSLSKIEDKVFYCCSSLEKVDFSKSSVSSIGIKSFSGCGILGNPIGPSSLASFPSSLTSIGSNSFYGTSITSLAIPDGVVSIGDRAFADCLALKEVSLGSGKKLTSIGEGIFSGDYLLSSLTVPFVASSRNLSSSSALTCFGYFFGSASFKGASLVSQYYSSSSSVDYYVPDALSTVEVTGTNPLFYGAFYGCSKIKSITINKKLTPKVYPKAFYGCSALVSFTCPTSLSEIDESTFENNTSLRSIRLGDGLSSIKARAFYGCSSLASINLPSTISSIGESAFYGCSSISKLTLPADLKTIGGYAFYGCSAIDKLTLPSELKTIGDYAFSGCSSLTSIAFPSGLTSIGAFAFSGASKLETISIGDKVIKIGESAFDETSFYNKASNWVNNLLTITSETSGSSYLIGAKDIYGVLNIKEGTKLIMDNVFNGKSNLVSVVCPNSLEMIGGKAFSSCPSLKTFVFHSTIKSIGDGAFASCPLLYLFYDGSYLPYNLTNSWNPSARPIIFNFAGELGVSGGVEYALTKDGTNTYATIYHLVSPKEDVILPSTIGAYSVKAIGPQALAGESLIKSVSIPSVISSIGDKAFLNCSSLTGLLIPSSVTSIGDYAFKSCSSLEKMTLPEKSLNLGVSLFSGCSSLETIELPSKLKKIDSGMFFGCKSLSSVKMGNEVGTIGASAFDDTLIYNEKSNWNNGSLAISSTDGATIYLVGYRPVDGAAKVEVGAKIMADSLFANMTSLTSVVLPSSLVRIPDRLFFGCTSLKTLLIPSSVTSIGALSFKGCSSLSLFFSASSLPSTFSNDFSYGAKGYYWYSENANYDGHHWHYVDGVPTVWVKPA